ncbi:50S ribosomal protein L3 [Patescibacteria group bacterium]|nr:50S ribosomal protein L3 [Patescibacteria group bacterium]
MPTKKSPRKGSLQYWPRKRASKFLPRVNWSAILSNSENKKLKGFIGYKAGMASAYIKDDTPNSMTKGKKIVIPVTLIECPPLKIFSVRFYKNGKVVNEILGENLDKELKRKIKLPKKKSENPKRFDFAEIEKEKFDDVTVLCYSVVKRTNIKKTPDLSEIGIWGTLEEKLNFVKENLNKEISILDIFKKGELIDFRGLTKGKGFQGPVKRFGVGLRQHKSEKGRRGPGSIGPWHPARVTFRTPMAGQLGMFTRVSYNNKIVEMGKSQDNPGLKGRKKYGDLKTDFIIVNGSVQGPVKRQLVLSATLRPVKKQLKKNYEFIELR